MDSELATLLLLAATVLVVIAATIVLTLWFAGLRRSNAGTRPSRRL